MGFSILNFLDDIMLTVLCAMYIQSKPFPLDFSSILSSILSSIHQF